MAAGPGESATAELAPATFLGIVDQLLAVSPAPMLILSGGEPLLREDLTEIARYASEKGATVVVGTNGTLLSDERIAALKQAGGGGGGGWGGFRGPPPPTHTSPPPRG